MSNDKKANGYAVILSIAVVSIFTYCNAYKFHDVNFPQILITSLLFFEFIFIAGILETISKKKSYAGVLDIILGTLLIIVFYYIFIRNDDFGKIIVLIIAIITIYMIIEGFCKIYKSLDLNNGSKKASNIILMIFQITSFILAVLQLLQMFKIIE